MLLVGHQGLVVPERDRRGDDAHVVDEPDTVPVRCGDGERDDAAIPVPELECRDPVLGLPGQPEVADVCDPWVGGEEVGHRLGVLRSAAATGAAGSSSPA